MDEYKSNGNENGEENTVVNFVMQSPEPEEHPEAEAQAEVQAEEATQAEVQAEEVTQAEFQAETQEESNADAVYGQNAENRSTYSQDAGTGSTYSSYDYSSYDYSRTERDKKPEKKKKSGKGKKWASCVAMAVVFGLVASVVFTAGNRLFGGIFRDNQKTNQSVSTTQVTTNTGASVNSDVAKVAANVMPSVVSITNLSVQEVQNFFFGGTTTQETTSSGSGIIIGQNDSELLIVTNNHVVEGSNTLTVLFADDVSAEAQIKGTDADIDIAVIAVPLSSLESSTLDTIKVATLGDSDALSVGEPAIAIGNALGYGQSVTCGIISALNREIDGFDTKLIQTDAAINPGNSGGALLNANGEVIGINTVKVSADAVEGMGYAIPISDVNDVINELMNRETKTKVNAAERGTIGIKGISVDENTSKLYGIPQGVQVSEILKGGAAEAAGLPKNCIITKFDGTRISSMDDLQEQLEYYKAGEQVEIEVKVWGQNGEYEEKTYELTLGKQSILN